MDPRHVALHWSGGKDSALALSLLLAREDVVVDRLLTTVHPELGASTVHELPTALVHAQARSIGLPLHTVDLPGPGLEGYVETMDAAAADLRSQGIRACAFGDLDVSGARAFHEEQFGPWGIEVLEPLEGMTSSESLTRFLAAGFVATTVVVDAAVLGVEHLGVTLDTAFLDALPPGVDPAGEFGEYHSFVHDGPIFRVPVAFVPGGHRCVEHDIGTTAGVRRHRYRLATPGTPPEDSAP
ncbi:hypothetical protein [Janibacter sp. GS2]|uniref:Dph6-related ATP pyrophosphatase n=1 Tax=Janibacter sp. GS2 TaxID=3442646 RepID=UPI003EBFC1FF